jgi:hypothetical protein
MDDEIESILYIGREVSGALGLLSVCLQLLNWPLHSLQNSTSEEE